MGDTTTLPDGVVLALGPVPPEARDLPAGVRVPGLRVFEVVDGSPSELTRYDLTLPGGLGELGRREAVRATVRGLGAGASDETELRGYELLGVQPDDTWEAADSSPFMLAVWISTAPGTEDEFNDWYDTEHVRELLRLEGWLHTRRYRRVVGGGPEYLALHYLADLDVFDDPAFDRIQRTPWRDRLLPMRRGHERRVCRTAGD